MPSARRSGSESPKEKRYSVGGAPGGTSVGSVLRRPRRMRLRNGHTDITCEVRTNMTAMPRRHEIN